MLSSARAHFLITPFGYKVLTARASDAISIRPTKTIDFSLYEHDVRITMIRSLTEGKANANTGIRRNGLKPRRSRSATPRNTISTRISGPMLSSSTRSRRRWRWSWRSRVKRRLGSRRRSGFMTIFWRRIIAPMAPDGLRSSTRCGLSRPSPQVVRFLQKMIERSRHPLCYRVDHSATRSFRSTCVE